MGAHGRGLPFLVCLLALFAMAGVARADFQERVTLRADRLELDNLIGKVSVVGHSGADFEVEVRAQGRDATRDNLTVETREGSRAGVAIRFPREDRFVYPRLGARSKTRFDLDGDRGGFSGFLSSLFGSGDQITVAGGGRGVELWADVTVRVPARASVVIRHGVGEIEANDVEGNVLLELRSGAVTAASLRGDLTVDIGSGKANVSDVDGVLNVDTGSGTVNVSRVRSASVLVDTGSGGIYLNDVDAGTLTLDTGSGSVDGDGLAADEAIVDTGSGSVRLGFVRIGGGRFEIDTGSGSIGLSLPANASARISADTSSGGVRVDFPGADIVRMEREEAEVVIGGGDADITLDTGSGSIQITHN